MLRQLNQSAQAQLGEVASRLATGAWSPSPSWRGERRSVASWAHGVAAQVLELRELSAELAVAYYQLNRWLATGRSLGDPVDGADSGAGLFEVFLSRVETVAGLESDKSDIGDDLRSVSRRGSSDVVLSLDELRRFAEQVSGLSFSGSVEVDPFDWPVLDSSRDTVDGLTRLLTNRALKTVDRQLTAAEELSAESYAAEVERISEKAGARGAGLADSAVLDAGRGMGLWALESDDLVVAYARGTSADPCAFCAMLASRGFTAYKATKGEVDSGALKAEVRSYHPNCHCYPIVAYGADAELPPLSQFFADNWDLTAEYRGSDKMKVWRRWMSQWKKEGKLLEVAVS